MRRNCLFLMNFLFFYDFCKIGTKEKLPRRKEKSHKGVTQHNHWSLCHCYGWLVEGQFVWSWIQIAGYLPTGIGKPRVYLPKACETKKTLGWFFSLTKKPLIVSQKVCVPILTESRNLDVGCLDCNIKYG